MTNHRHSRFGQSYHNHIPKAKRQRRRSEIRRAGIRRKATLEFLEQRLLLASAPELAFDLNDSEWDSPLATAAAGVPTGSIVEYLTQTIDPSLLSGDARSHDSAVKNTKSAWQIYKQVIQPSPLVAMKSCS